MLCGLISSYKKKQSRKGMDNTRPDYHKTEAVQILGEKQGIARVSLEIKFKRKLDLQVRSIVYTGIYMYVYIMFEFNLCLGLLSSGGGVLFRGGDCAGVWLGSGGVGYFRMGLFV